MTKYTKDYLIGAISYKEYMDIVLNNQEARMDKLGQDIALSKYQIDQMIEKNKFNSCPICHEFKALKGSMSHPFGTEAVCLNCSDPKMETL